MKDLIEILSWCRGAGTVSEKLFVEQHIATIPDAWADDYGNYHVTIGKDPQILWSCHTDTVTRKEGRQNVKWIGKGLLGLNNPQTGQCLGADNGAGIWIMMELIKANKEGHYVFHRDEEIGGLGSMWISKNSYVLPKGLKAAIAMDRNGNQDIITHQGFQRTASDEFARTLAEQLPTGMRADDGGVFTDTANYTDLIGECTNLGCGYERNHGPNETLDVFHLRRLRDSLLKLEYSTLAFVRNPGELEYADWYGMGAYGGAYYDEPRARGNGFTTYPSEGSDMYDEWVRSREDEDGHPFGDAKLTLEDMVAQAPDIAARLITELGVSEAEFRAHVFAIKGILLDA